MNSFGLDKQKKMNDGGIFMRLGTKIIAMVLCIAFGVGSVAACGKKDSSKEDSRKAEASAQDTAGNELSVAETDEKADEDEAPTDEREGYEDRVDSLEYIFEDEEIYVLDLCQEGLSVAVLTSDHLAGMVNPVFDEMDHTLRVPEDAVELLGGLSGYSYVIKNQSGEISRYEALTTDRGEILEIVPKIITFEGLTVGNYYFNVSIRGTSYIGYLDGKISLEKAIEQVKTNTRQYAKRQLTWFRKDTAIQWLAPQQVGEMIEWVESKI